MLPKKMWATKQNQNIKCKSSTVEVLVSIEKLLSRYGVK
jgi:hypothetical protein